MYKALLVSLLCLCVVMLFTCKDKTKPPAPGELTHTSYRPKPYPYNLPEGFPRFEVPKDNPGTVEGVSLGEKLFFDPLLSADNTMSCSSCHFPHLAMTDKKARSTGIDGKEGIRSAMSLINVAYYREGLFWDGRVKTLEEQALLPVEDSVELHNSWDEVLNRLKKHSEYPALFRKAFGISSIEEMDKYLAVKAIAQYERSLISGNTKFDRFRRGEAVLSEEEMRGYELFFDASPDLPDAECGHCHNAPLMTTNEYLNNGISEAFTTEDFTDKGYGLITGNPLDNGKFRVPSLRNIILTAPYMHDGRFKTLEEVIEHYNSGGKHGPNVSPLIRPLNLNEVQKRQLIAFLETLTDPNFTQQN